MAPRPLQRACKFLFALALLCAGVSGGSRAEQPAQSAATADAAISAADARRAIGVLQDEKQRAEALRALKAIVEVAPAAAPAATGASAPPPAAPSASGADATPAPATPANSGTAETAIVPLERNGLIAQLLRGVRLWMDDLREQIADVKRVVVVLPLLYARSGEGLTAAHNQEALRHVAAVLALAFGAGLLAEAGMSTLLRRPRRQLAQHALHAEGRALGRERRHEAARTAGAVHAPATHAEDRGTPGLPARAGALQPANQTVALVQTMRDGIEGVEEVPVGSDNAAGGRQASAAMPARRPHKRAVHRPSMRTLGYLPYAVGMLLLQLLPPALFFLAATFVSRLLYSGEPRTHAIVGTFIFAYTALRLTMVAAHVLFEPVAHGLRILHISDPVADRLQRFIRNIVALALFGMAIADAAALLGGGAAIRLALLKGVSLLVHIGIVIVILQLRRPIGAAIRGSRHQHPPDGAGAWVQLRFWLGQVWAYLAIALVMGVWVVWALGVQDGFPKLMHFIFITIVILVAARIISMVLLGTLARILQIEGGRRAASEPSGNPKAGVAPRLARYYPFLRSLITVSVTFGAAIILLDAWGLDALDWFAAGTLGRSMASALITITVSVLAAIVLWEWVQYKVNGHLDRWTQQGDLVRAARLRTLLPMLRTLLLIAVGLVVGLTALNEIGVNTTPLLAGASIIGVAVGFGSQKLVQDFITGIFLLMENAMRVGDWVTVAGVSGSVEYLSIRTVRLRGGDGSLYIVPFSSVSMVNNTNRGLGNAAVRIGVGFDADIGRAIDQLKQIGADLRADPAFKERILADMEVWGVDSVDGSMVMLAGQMRCTDKGRWGVQREINRRILESFRKLGITVADPRTTRLLPAGPLGAEPGQARAAAAARAP